MKFVKFRKVSVNMKYVSSIEKKYIGGGYCKMHFYDVNTKYYQEVILDSDEEYTKVYDAIHEFIKDKEKTVLDAKEELEVRA